MLVFQRSQRPFKDCCTSSNPSTWQSGVVPSKIRSGTREAAPGHLKETKLSLMMRIGGSLPKSQLENVYHWDGPAVGADDGSMVATIDDRALCREMREDDKFGSQPIGVAFLLRLAAAGAALQYLNSLSIQGQGRNITAGHCQGRRTPIRWRANMQHRTQGDLIIPAGTFQSMIFLSPGRIS